MPELSHQEIQRGAGRGNPRSDHLVERIATILGIPREVVFYYADRIPPEMRQIEWTSEGSSTFTAFHLRIVAGS